MLPHEIDVTARVPGETGPRDYPEAMRMAADGTAWGTPLEPAGVGERRRRRVETTGEEMAAELESRGEIRDRIFERHQTIVWEDDTVVTVLVTPRYAVVLNQTRGLMEARWFVEDPKLPGGGLTWNQHPVTLIESQGYTPHTLPAFSYYGADVLGVCDDLGRVTLWAPATGDVIATLFVTEEPFDPKAKCVAHPSVFAVSSEFVVVCKALTDTTAAVYSIRYAANDALGPYGQPDTVFDMFVQSIAHPRYGRANETYPFEFYITSDHGLGVLNLVVPPPMRAVIPALRWMQSAYVETSDTELVDKATSGPIQTLANVYTEKIAEWAAPDYREFIASSFDAGEWTYNLGRHDLGVDDPLNPCKVAHDHATIVQRIRDIVVPVVPEQYRCVHFSASADLLIGTGPTRVTWNDREANAFYPTNAVNNALASEAVEGGFVSITAGLTLVYVQAPMVTETAVTTSTLLQLTHDYSVTSEKRAVTRPRIEDGEVVSRGAPLGTTLAVNGPYIVCHTFEHAVWVYTLGEYTIANPDDLADAIGKLSIETDAKAEVVLDAPEELPSRDDPLPLPLGVSLRTTNIADLWYQAADEASVLLTDERHAEVAAAEAAPAMETEDGAAAAAAPAMETEGSPPAIENPCVPLPSATDWLTLAEEIATADGDAFTDDDDDFDDDDYSPYGGWGPDDAIDDHAFDRLVAAEAAAATMPDMSELIGSAPAPEATPRVRKRGSSTQGFSVAGGDAAFETEPDDEDAVDWAGRAVDKLAWLRETADGAFRGGPEETDGAASAPDTMEPDDTVE